MNLENTGKNKKLAFSIIFDAVGYTSYVFPLIDIGWAPLSAYLMTKLYKGKKGKIAAVITFIEEALPGFDFIPTFTLMWLYTYIFKGKNKETIIEINTD